MSTASSAPLRARVVAYVAAALVVLAALRGFSLWYVLPSKERAALERAQMLKDSKFASRLIVCDRQKIVFCPVPKVASSNWKFLLARICLGEEEASKYNIEQLHNKRQTPLVTMDKLPVSLIADTYRNHWFRFAFVRDPATRLVSAYINKIRDGYDFAYVSKTRPAEEYISYIASIYSWKYVGEHDLEKEGPPSFAEFVDAVWRRVTSEPNFELNEHWAPQSELCGFGKYAEGTKFHYSYIGYFENYSRDADRALSQLGLADLRFPDQKTMKFPSTGASEEAPTLISERVEEQLRNLYEEDYRTLRRYG